MFRYDRLDDLVKESGKKKNYLSQKMGFTGRYLNDAKKQNTDIKGEPLVILAAELNTTPEYLTGKSDIKEKAPTRMDGRELPHADLREVLAGKGVRIMLDADAKLTEAQLEDIVNFIEFQQGKNGK